MKRLCLLLIVVNGVWSPAADDSAAKMREQAAQSRELLKTSLVDSYLPSCVDEKNGRYMENLDAQGKFTLTGEKFLTLQGRHVWFFSTVGWWATGNAYGSPAPDKSRTSMWQGAYHAGRALIESSHRLESLAEKGMK
jgi:mannose/cellobiose epimerase-like protein (N-acyl-D-glucosamine 2-epimerase family)